MHTNNNKNGFVVLGQDTRVYRPVSDFRNTFPELERVETISFAGKIYKTLQIRCANVQHKEGSQSFAKEMPNKGRETAGDRMELAVPILFFEDDVSGNESKQWNKHFVVYGQNGNLPREMLEKEISIRFFTGSPHATSAELMQGIRECLECVLHTILVYATYQAVAAKLPRRGSWPGMFDISARWFYAHGRFFSPEITPCRRSMHVRLASTATFPVVLVNLAGRERSNSRTKGLRQCSR